MIEIKKDHEIGRLGSLAGVFLAQYQTMVLRIETHSTVVGLTVFHQ